MNEQAQMLINNFENQLKFITELQNMTDEDYLAEYDKEYARQESLYPYEDFGR